MLAVERQLKISELVEKNGGIKTSELSRIFDVTGMTILRDLSFLERQGVLKRVHGGAITTRNSTQEISIIMRKRINIDKKNIIAQKAATLISNGDSLFLDGSTTALALAKNITGKMNLTVISNGLGVIDELKDNPEIDLISTGGKLNKKTLNFVGPNTYSFIKEFFVDKAFISAAGISLSVGLTNENQEQSKVKKIMLDNALQKIAIMDSSKFDKIRLSKVCGADELSIFVTDKSPPQEYIDYFKDHNIELIF